MSTPARNTALPLHISVPGLSLAVSSWLLVATSIAGFLPPLQGAESTPAAPAQTAVDEDLLRSFLELQGQLHSLQLAVDKNSQDTSEAAKETAEQMGRRLNGIEQALAAQRARELEAMQSSNRVMLTVAGTFAGVGLLAMVCMAYFQWRTISRLAEISAALPVSRLLGPGAAGWAGDHHLLTSGAAEDSNARLTGSLERLEKRLIDLEHTARTEPRGALPAQTPTTLDEAHKKGNGNSTTVLEEGGQSKLSLLLAKGQSLLNMDRAQEALAVFDDALKAAPNDGEALLKRAVALERMGQLQEALECCDRAIAADRTSTMAYLQKGGLYNRMERFEEAIQCYEAALQAKG
jgi:tetratricopeptide (TPR) repeat protein